MAVAYTINGRDKSNDGKKLNSVTIAYTAEPYSSGLPVDLNSLGFVGNIEALTILDGLPATGNILKWSPTTGAGFTAGKIRAYAESAGTYAEVSGNQTFTITVFVQGW